jgi:hypothetical protein
MCSTDFKVFVIAERCVWCVDFDGCVSLEESAKCPVMTLIEEPSLCPTVQITKCFKIVALFDFERFFF